MSGHAIRGKCQHWLQILKFYKWEITDTRCKGNCSNGGGEIKQYTVGFSFLQSILIIIPGTGTVLRLMFFVTTSGPYTESALPFLNLIDILTVDNVYHLHALKFTHIWHKGLLPKVFDNLFQYAKSRHTYNTRYASKQNFCKPRIRTNTGKQMFSYKAIDLWHDIPCYLKDLSTFSFAKEVKQYLLFKQYS